MIMVIIIVMTIVLVILNTNTDKGPRLVAPLALPGGAQTGSCQTDTTRMDVGLIYIYIYIYIYIQMDVGRFIR